MDLKKSLGAKTCFAYFKVPCQKTTNITDLRHSKGGEVVLQGGPKAAGRLPGGLEQLRRGLRDGRHGRLQRVQAVTGQAVQRLHGPRHARQHHVRHGGGFEDSVLHSHYWLKQKKNDHESVKVLVKIIKQSHLRPDSTNY